MPNETFCNGWSAIADWIPRKILVHGLRPKIFPAYDISGCSKIQFFSKKEIYEVDFLHMVRHPQKHQIDLDISNSLGQTPTDMPKVLQNHKLVTS